MIKAQRGTKDIYKDEIYTWDFIFEKARKVFENSGFSEIKTPIFEATELFSRGVGESSDIVNKEMYTFSVGKDDKTSITLRPENTAGVVRAFIEHGLNRTPAPQKFWYFAPMFRYERPQAGRQRQFYQAGVEMFGIEDARADAETILTAVEFLNELGLNNLEVEINSLGCKKCKNEYRNNLKEAIKPYLDELCDDCKMRYEKNPLRILDCKNEDCQKILDKIKDIISKDYICEECKEHFEKLKKYLDCLDIKYKVNKFLVRGLDYYTRTVFEIKSERLGSQSAVCGGGRYDNLVETLGGTSTPAIGFAMGVERLCSLIDKKEAPLLDFYVVSNNENEAFKLVKKLRKENKRVEMDLNGKKFSKQLEKASKIAKYALILGDDEIKDNFYSVKNLSLGEQKRYNNFNDLLKL